MPELPPATLARFVAKHERTYLRQLSIMLREASHVVSALQSLRDEPMTRLMRADLVKALLCHIHHVDRLADEVALLGEGGKPQ